MDQRMAQPPPRRGRPPRATPRLCGEPDCGRVHASRGLCMLHWKRAYGKPDVYHRECAWCGKAYATRYRRGRCCSRECGHRFAGRLAATFCAVPDDHPSRSTPVPPDHPSRVVAPKFTPVRYGDCAGCGRCFVDRSQGSPARWCSKLCVKRHERRKRKARERGAPGMFTWAELMRKFADQDGCCTYCLRAVDGKPEPDHVVPLSRDGSNWISNVVPSCHECNHDKSDRLPHEWARRRQDCLQPELPGLAGMLDPAEQLLLIG
jgi:5-methylcytosine-specific restriction endonuclease McrA